MELKGDSTVVAYFRSSDLERDHTASVICYKAIQHSKWLCLAEAIKNNPKLKKVFISFGYDNNEPGETAYEIVQHTKILTDPKLVQAMKLLLPHCIASHKDMFAALEDVAENKNIKVDEDDEDDEDENKNEDPCVWN
jgi:hypothetical protein